MDAITPKTRLGFRGGRLVCPECKTEGCQIISLKDAKSRQYPCNAALAQQYADYKRLTPKEKRERLPRLQREVLTQHLLSQQPPKGVDAKAYASAVSKFAEKTVHDKLATAEWQKAWKANLESLKHSQTTTGVTIRIIGDHHKTRKDGTKGHGEIHESWTESLPTSKAKLLKKGKIEQHSAEYTKLLEVLNSAGRNDVVVALGTLASTIESANGWLEVSLGATVEKPKGVPAQARSVRTNDTPIVSCPHIKVELQVHDGILEFVRKDSLPALPSNNDCFPTAALQVFKPSWDKAKATSKNTSAICNRHAKALELHTLEEWLGRPIDRTQGESVETMEAIHAKLKARATVIDPKGNVLHRYEPPSITHHGASAAVYVQHNNHVWACDAETTKSLTQILKDKPVHDPNAPVDLPSSHMSVKSNRFKASTYLVANDFSELAHALASTLETKGQSYQILFNGSLLALFNKLRQEYRYEASVRTSDRQLTALILNLQNTYTITDVMHGKAVDRHSLEAAHYKTFTDYLCQMLNALMDETFVNYYSANLRRAINHFRKANLVARFIPGAPEKSVQVDRIRAYTAELKNLDKVPVFNAFDDFELYRGQDIDDHSFYIVESTRNDPEAWIIANEKYSMLTGYVLKRCFIAFNILYVIRPSHLVPNHATPMVKKLYTEWNDEGCDHYRKLAVNTAIGMTCKRTAVRENSWFTTDLEETQGCDHPIPVADGYLCVRKSDEVELDNGFYAGWQFAIYDRHRLAMLNLYRELQAKGATIYGISTDALCIDALPKGFPVATGKSYEKLGLASYVDTPKTVPARMFEQHNNENPIKHTRTQPWTQVDTLTDRTLVMARVPGAGKTFTTYHGSPKDALWVSPQQRGNDRLEKEYGIPQSITYHALLGIGVGESKCSAHDLEDVRWVCMDELGQLDDSMKVRVLQWVSRLKKSRPDIAVVANLDLKQTTNGFSLNNVDRHAYFDKVLQRVFQHYVWLDKNYRLKTDEDRALFDSLLHNLFEKRWHPVKCLREAKFKFVNTLEQVKAKGIKRIISLERAVADYFNDSLGSITVGGLVVCKHRKDKRELIKNKRYVVEAIRPNQLLVGGQWRPREWFAPDCAATCHSVQGDKIDEPFLIVGADHFHADAEWVWTAITRATRASDVYIWCGPNIHSLERMRKDAEVKIERHRATDALKGHECDLTADWVLKTYEEQKGCCAICGERMEMVCKDGDQWSADRLNNDLGHLQSNCRLVHLTCNKARK